MNPELVLLLRALAFSVVLIGLEILTTPRPTKKPLPRKGYGPRPDARRCSPSRYRDYERSLKRSYGDKRAPNR